MGKNTGSLNDDIILLIKDGKRNVEIMAALGATKGQVAGVRARAGLAGIVPVKQPVIAAAVYHSPKSALQPSATERIGGRVVLRNNVTGEVVRKASVQSAYLHAQIAGWTDYDWAEVGGVADDL